MDRLWTPWRYQYISTAKESSGCIFCDKPAERKDEENYIVHRAECNYVMLNAFPYTSGHMMIAPYEHVATPELAREETLVEMMLLTRQAVVCLAREQHHLDQRFFASQLRCGDVLVGRDHHVTARVREGVQHHVIAFRPVDDVILLVLPLGGLVTEDAAGRFLR